MRAYTVTKLSFYFSFLHFQSHLFQSRFCILTTDFRTIYAHKLCFFPSHALTDIISPVLHLSWSYSFLPTSLFCYDKTPKTQRCNCPKFKYFFPSTYYMEENFYLMSIFSIVGSVLIWKGIWGLLDTYLPPSTMTEISCVVLGAALVYLSYQISLR